MPKIKISSGRGTGSIEVDVEEGDWTGDEFCKKQLDKKLKSKNKTISFSRGTSSKKYKDIPDPINRPSTEGSTRITGRGTSTNKVN